MEFDQESLKVLYSQGRPALVAFLDDSEESQQLFSLVEALSYGYKYQLRFHFVMDESPYFDYLSQFLGVANDPLPNIVLTYPRGRTAKFKLDGAVDERKLKVN